MRLTALLRQRCPHCLEGAVFSGLIQMHQTCPVCAITYEREHGFFMMSVFLGYVLGLAVLAPVLLALWLLQATIWWYVVASAAILIPLSPLIFRYARVIWLHLDELMDPRTAGESPVRPGSRS
jgi:uncharacterized protein (DUF983 family)